MNLLSYSETCKCCTNYAVSFHQTFTTDGKKHISNHNLSTVVKFLQIHTNENLLLNRQFNLRNKTNIANY